MCDASKTGRLSTSIDLSVYSCTAMRLHVCNDICPRLWATENEVPEVVGCFSVSVVFKLAFAEHVFSWLNAFSWKLQ